MARKIGYHYSNAKYEVGDVISPYDNLPGLHPVSLEVENLIRSAHPRGAEIRSKAVYLWDDEARARQQWATAGRTKMAKRYLYKVEYEEDDLLHKGDLNHYTDAREFADAVAKSAAAASYWNGELHKKEPPRVEVLVGSATVVAAEQYSPPPPAPYSDADFPFLPSS